MYTPKQYFKSVIKDLPSFLPSFLPSSSIKKSLCFVPRIQCLSIEEMIAEKCTTALTRRKPAIRDFFDLWYLQKAGLDIFAHENVIIQKCKEINELKRTLLNQYEFLESQIETELKPFLKKNDYYFDLKAIYGDLLDFQKILIEKGNF